MSISHDRQLESLPEHTVFIVRFRNEDDDIKATRAMARATGDGVAFDGKGNNRINRVQYEELLRTGISHEIVSAPPSYKSANKIRRK
jgi:hypothetical protein